MVCIEIDHRACVSILLTGESGMSSPEELPLLTKKTIIDKGIVIL